MPHMPRIGGVTWEFGDQEPIFLSVPPTSKGMRSAPMRRQAMNPAPSSMIDTTVNHPRRGFAWQRLEHAPRVGQAQDHPIGECEGAEDRADHRSHQT